MRSKLFYLLILCCCIIFFYFLISYFNIAGRKAQTTVDHDNQKIENVILIIACSLRADHLSCYGYDRETSPNIDQLARNGIFYKNCIVQAPFTVGSIPSIMTAQYPRKLFRMNNFIFTIPDAATTFAEIFKANGFSTLGFMANPWVSKVFNFNQGFDYFYDSSDMLKKYNTEDERLANRVWGDDLTGEAIARLRDVQGRFFLQILYTDCHDPYIPFPDFGNTYKSDTSKPAITNVYDETILSLDHHIGTLLDELKALGLFENTLIIFTADHGEAFTEYNSYDERHGLFLYNTVIKVPLIFSNPNLSRKGVIVEDYVTGIDILPTSLDMAGITYDEEAFDGCSLHGYDSSIFSSENSRRRIVSETNFINNRGTLWRSCLIWDQRWKLIYNYDTTVYSNGLSRQLPVFELYDLKNDPREMKNLEDQDRDFTLRLVKVLLKWQKSNTSTLSNKAKFKEDSIEKLPPELTDQLKTLGYIE